MRGPSARKMLRKSAPADPRAVPHWEEWHRWFREDFLRYCFLVGALAWDGFGAVQIMDSLDPWYFGKGPSPAHVYVAMLAFVVLSTVGHALLYRHWWPSEGRVSGGSRVARLENWWWPLRRRGG